MKKVIIIDDEPLACTIIKEYLESYPELEIVTECHDGFEAAKAIAHYQPDLLFLDIQMPKLNGFELLEIIHHTPDVIFTTAYDEYALKAFEANALDYLLKPFSQERFDQAVQKWQNTTAKNTGHSAKKLDNTPHKLPEERRRIVIKENSEIKIIPTVEVAYIEAYGDYVKIHHKGKTFLKNKTMKYFEQTLTSSRFMRIHRSYIINVDQLTKIEAYQKNKYIAILRTGAKIPISRTAYGPLKEMLGI